MTKSRRLWRGILALTLAHMLCMSNAFIMAMNDKEILAKIKSLKEQLLTAQSEDGRWSVHGYHSGGTALVLLALKHAGLSNNHKAVRKAVAFLRKNSDGKVYSESLVICALAEVNAKRYKFRINKAMNFLLNPPGSTTGWNYVKRQGTDNSNTQFAVMALMAAKRSGFRIPTQVKRTLKTYFFNSQNADGGWGYHPKRPSSFAMTCAGLASLSLLEVEHEKSGHDCGKYVIHKRMNAGLQRLHKYMDSGGRAPTLYTLYALERVAIYLDLKTVGDIDWYRFGARSILAQEQRNLQDRAFALLFLAKRFSPIAVAKWKFKGKWDVNRRDVSNWIDIASTELKRELDWIPASISKLNSPAAKASVIYANGHGEIAVSDKEALFIRKFLEKQGSIVAEACCADDTFFKSFQKAVSEKVFPGAGIHFSRMGANHAVMSSHFNLDPTAYEIYEAKGGCRQYRIILIRGRNCCALNGEGEVRKSLGPARRLYVNLLAHALKSKNAIHVLDNVELDDGKVTQVSLTEPKKSDGPPEALKYAFPVGRVMHRGDWETDSRFFSELRKNLSNHRDLPHFDGEINVHPLAKDIFFSGSLYMVGHGDPDLSAKELEHIRRYLQNGGFLFSSTCCSNPKYHQGFLRMLKKLFPRDEVEQIPKNSAIWQSPYPCKTQNLKTSKAYAKTYQSSWAPLLGLRREGRWMVVHSPVDLCCDLEGDLDENTIAYKKSSALRLLTNIFYQSLRP